HSIRIRLFGSIVLTLTSVEKPYISQSHLISLPTSNLLLPLVNQNLDVMVGSIKASNTSATGLRISISAFADGTLLSVMMRSFRHGQMITSAAHHGVKHASIPKACPSAAGRHRSSRVPCRTSQDPPPRNTAAHSPLGSIACRESTT